jgi:hypothetical protein
MLQINASTYPTQWAHREGSLRLQVFSSILADSASFHAVIIITTPRYTRALDPNFYIIYLLLIKDMAISEIRGVFLDDRRSTSDPLTTAVVYLTYYEAVFGSRAICRTYMRGLKAMKTLTGGLSAQLQKSLEHIVLWTSSEASSFTRSHSHSDSNIYEPVALHATILQSQASCPAVHTLLFPMLHTEMRYYLHPFLKRSAFQKW